MFLLTGLLVGGGGLGCWFERTAYFVRPYTRTIDTSSKKIIAACCFVRKLIQNDQSHMELLYFCF